MNASQAQIIVMKAESEQGHRLNKAGLDKYVEARLVLAFDLFRDVCMTEDTNPLDLEGVAVDSIENDIRAIVRGEWDF